MGSLKAKIPLDSTQGGFKGLSDAAAGVPGAGCLAKVPARFD